jgi:drug/metabolite transporter (DMT)-like permease
MVELWFFYIISAVVIWGANAIIDKIILTKHLNSFSYFVTYAPPKILILIFILLFFPTNYNSFPFYLAFVAGVLAVFGYYTYAYAMKREEASRIYLLANIYPGFTAVLAAIFLNEIFSLNSYIGIALILFGTALISYKKSQTRKIIPIIVIVMALSPNFFYGIEQTISKISLNSVSFWQFFGAYLAGNLFTIIPALAVPSFRNNFAKEIKRLRMKTVILVEFSGFAWLLGVILFMFSISLAPVTLVSTISIFTPFVVLLCTILISKYWPKILKEDVTSGVIWLKILAMILVFAGTYLLVA